MFAVFEEEHEFVDEVRLVSLVLLCTFEEEGEAREYAQKKAASTHLPYSVRER